MQYQTPRLIVHGSVEALTMMSPDGNDDCSERGPRGYKQTGVKDLILGQAALQTCTVGTSA